MMDDLISRKVAIEALGERPIVWTDNDDYTLGERNQYDMDKLAIETVPSAQPDNQVNLCDSCKHTYPDCPSQNDDVIFGNGNGNDNICACAKYAPSSQPEPCEDAVSRAEAQTALQFVAKRYTVSREAHGEGYVEWSDNLISVPDAMNALREVPSVTPKEQRWIPCVDGNEPKANADCWISTNAKYVRRASYAPKANNQPNGFIVTEGGFGFYEYGKSAKAWMPYDEPEPFQEEGDE